MDHSHPVAHDERLVLVVCHEDCGDPQFHQKVVDLGAYLGTQAGVQVRERFVQEQHGGPRCQRPCKGHPLLLPTGEGPGHPAGSAVEAHEGEGLAYPFSTEVISGQAVSDVAGHVQVWEQRPVLEHHPDPPPLGWNEHTRTAHDPAAK